MASVLYVAFFLCLAARHLHLMGFSIGKGDMADAAPMSCWPLACWCMRFGASPCRCAW